jgi:hypothetical protein
MTTLSNEEKITIVNQHIKNVEFSKYNIEVSLIEENSIDAPDAAIISSLNAQLAEADAKLEALEIEKASLTE